MEPAGIKIRSETARAACGAYWLLVFAFLLIQLFPIAQIEQDLGYANKRSVAGLTIANDGLPPPGVDEIPIIPPVPALRPALNHEIRPQRPAFMAPQAPDFLAFQPRGPPIIV